MAAGAIAGDVSVLRAPPVTPPHDLNAERAVLGGILLENEALNAVTALPLKPRHFYRDAHAIIFEAMTELFADGQPIDSITLRERLTTTNKLQRVGGDEYLLALTDTIPTIANIEAHAQIVIAKAALRKAKHELREGMLAIDRGELEDAREAARRILEVTAEPEADRLARRVVWHGIDDLCKPLPPMPWLARGLHLGPGRPYLLIAYAFGLKSLTAQALALAVASGRPAWGHFECERGRVLHFDLEQGKRASVERYQRLMRGMELDARAVGENLRLTVFPDLRLTDADAADVLARACDGAQLAIIDSLRASIAGVEENSSEVRAPLDVLTRVSERTGCAFLVLHHAGKSGKDNGYADGRMVARGSSAIVDAAGGALVLHPPKEKGEPRRVEQVKSPAEAAGGAIDDFMLAVEDVACDGAEHGVRITYQSITAPSVGRTAQTAKDDEHVLETVRRNAGSSQNQLRALTRENHRISNQDLTDALSRLERAGKVRVDGREGKGGGRSYWPNGERTSAR